MNTFLQRGIKEHTRKNEMKREFAEQNRKMAGVIQNADFSALDAPDFLKDYERRCLILLAPLVEVAWVDGCVRTREMDAVFQVAEAYGLAENMDAYAELIDSMLSRALPARVEEQWRQFHELLELLSETDRETVAFCLMGQARFIAEQSSNDLIPYLRGDRISSEGREALQKILGELEKARHSLPETKSTFSEVEKISEADGSNGKLKDEEIAQLLPLVPLVKVAWAEGRITRREREIVLDAARRMGIEPGSLSHQRLTEWLELHPSDDFYTKSLERLHANLQKIPKEERTLRNLDLLSDCVNIAEASGGTSRYPAGGPRVCDEEIAAVKGIAEKINSRAAAAAY